MRTGKFAKFRVSPKLFNNFFNQNYQSAESNETLICPHFHRKFDAIRYRNFLKKSKLSIPIFNLFVACWPSAAAIILCHLASISCSESKGEEFHYRFSSDFRTRNFLVLLRGAPTPQSHSAWFTHLHQRTFWRQYQN